MDTAQLACSRAPETFFWHYLPHGLMSFPWDSTQVSPVRSFLRVSRPLITQHELIAHQILSIGLELQLGLMLGLGLDNILKLTCLRVEGLDSALGLGLGLRFGN